MNKINLFDDYATECFAPYGKRPSADYLSDIAKFVKKNEGLSDEQLFEKFKNEFPMLFFLHEAGKQKTLNKIQRNTNAVKIIIIIYLVLTIIGAFLYITQFL